MKILETSSSFLLQLNDYSENDLIDDFLVSCHASLTAKVLLLYGPYLCKTLTNVLKN